MKKVILLVMLALVAVASTEARPSKGDKELTLRIGSYNVWSHSARKSIIRKGLTTEARNWDNSKHAVADLIRRIDCDILGMQEVTSVCRDDLATLVGKGKGKKYELWWKNTYPEGHKSVIGNAVFYDKRRFELSEQSIYYFSPTPTEMSKGWDETRHYRAALTAVVTHKKSGKRFFLIATHGPLKPEANANAGRILVEIDKTYNTQGLPTVVVGDMNARPGEAFHQTMCTHFEDTFLVAEQKCGTIGTFNGSKGTDDNFSNPRRRIDHIYIHSTDKGKLTAKDYTVCRDRYPSCGEQHFPSDHNPLIVTMTLQ